MAGRPLADLFVNVKPDLSNFDREVAQGTRRARPIDITVNPKLARNWERELQRQTRGQSLDVTVKGKLDAGVQRSLQRELDRGDYNIKVKAGLDSGSLARIDRQLRDRTITVRVNQVGGGGGGGGLNPLPSVNGAGQGASATAFDFSSAGVAIKAVLIGAAVASAPLMGAAIGSGIVGGAGFGLIGAGIAAQLQDPKIKLAATSLVDDLKSQLITVTAGIADPLLGVLSQVGNVLEDNLEPLTSIFNTLGGYASDIGSSFTQAFGEILPQLDVAFQKAAPIFNVIAQGIYDIVRQVGDLFQDIGDNSQDFAAGLQLIFDFVSGAVLVTSKLIVILAKSIHDVSDLIANTLDAIGDARDFFDINNDGKDAGDGMHKRADAVRGYTDSLYSSVNALDVQKDAAGTAEKAADDLLKSQQSYANILGSLDPEQIKSNNNTALMAELYKTLGDETKTSEDRLKAFGTAIAGIDPKSDDFAALTGAIIREGEASGDTADEVSALKIALEHAAPGTGTFKLITDEIISVGLESTSSKDRLDALKTALDALIAPKRGVVDTFEEVKKGLLGISDAAKKNGTSLSENTTKGLANRDMVEQNVKGLEDYYTALINSGVPQDEAKRKTDAQRDAFVKNAEKAGFNKDEVKKLITQYGYLPSSVSTAIKTPGMDEARSKMEDLKKKSLKVDGPVTLDLKVPGYGTVKSHLEHLIAIQGTLYNPDYQTNKGGADTISSQVTIPKKATGGKLSGPGTGTSDQIPIMASNKEWVIRAASAAGYGDRFMSAVNNGTFPRVLAQAFANGGEVGDTSNNKSIYPFPTSIGGMKIPKNTGLAPGGGGGALGGGWRSQVAALARAGFIFHPSNGQTTGGGHAPGSYHYQGRAVDLSPPSAAAYKYILSHFGGSSKELIYAPFADSNIKNGRTHRYSSSILKAHYNHIHWAYANGGKVNAGNGYTLKQLDKLKKTQLNAIAKKQGQHGYTSLKKAALEQRILTYKPPAKGSKAYYEGLTESQLRALLKSKGVVIPKNTKKAGLIKLLTSNSTHKPGSNLDREANFQNGLANTQARKDSAHQKALDAAVYDFQHGGVSSKNLKFLQGLDDSELSTLASLRLTQDQARKLYAKLPASKRAAFAGAFGERLATNAKNAKNAPIFAKFAASTKATYSANATKLYNSLVKSGVAPSDAAQAASDLLSKGDDAISAKQEALGLSDKYNVKAPGALGGDVKIAADSIGQIVGGILARPAEVYVNRTKLAQTQDRDFARYLNTGVA